MPYDFAENEFELEAETSSARGGGPPRKLTGVGVLDPPFPPKRPFGPIPAVPSSLLFRIVAALLNAKGSLPAGAPFVIVVNDRRDLFPEILERAGLRLEERLRRHVNRRTGRRAGEFFEDVLIAR